MTEEKDDSFEVYCGMFSGQVTFYKSGKHFFAYCPAYERPRRISESEYERMKKNVSSG